MCCDFSWWWPAVESPFIIAVLQDFEMLTKKQWYSTFSKNIFSAIFTYFKTETFSWYIGFRTCLLTLKRFCKCVLRSYAPGSTPFLPVSPFLQQSLSDCLMSSSLCGSPWLLPVPLAYLMCSDFPCSAQGCWPQVGIYQEGSTKARTPRSHPSPFLFPTLLFRWLPSRVTQRSEPGPLSSCLQRDFCNFSLPWGWCQS